MMPARTIDARFVDAAARYVAGAETPNARRMRLVHVNVLASVLDLIEAIIEQLAAALAWLAKTLLGVS